MRVVITGGAGFIGANLARVLAGDERFEQVTVVDDLSTGHRANLDGLDVRFVEGSINDDEVLDEACAGTDAIVHLAARPSVPRSLEDPVATHLANATGTLSVLEAARRHGNPHVVAASSSSVYGANPTLPKGEDLRPVPLSPYAASKLATETYALSHAHCFALPVLVFRFFNVFGPLQPAGHAYAAAIPAFIDAALHGRPVPIDGDGKQTRDFTFVGSVAAVITEVLLARTTNPDPVNLAFGSRRTILEVIDELERILDVELEREHRPPRPGDVRHSQADRTRLERLVPHLEPVDFTSGLRETVAWFQTLPAQA